LEIWSAPLIASRSEDVKNDVLALTPGTDDVPRVFTVTSSFPLSDSGSNFDRVCYR